MTNKPCINGEAINAAIVSVLAAEHFLNERYSFRRNVLSGKVEFTTKSAKGQETAYRPLTQEALIKVTQCIVHNLPVHQVLRMQDGC